jgi:two-component system response regulator HydG
MSAELILMNGPQPGSRFAIGEEPVLIGRATEAAIRIDDPQAAWRHCTITREDGGYRLTDLRTGSGTFVNGLKVDRQALNDEDQISIGDATLLFREGGNRDAEPGAQATLLKACSLLFLFRALAESDDAEASALLSNLLLQLIYDVVPGEAGALLLAKSTEQLRREARRSAPAWETMLVRACTEGLIFDARESVIAMPLYARRRLAGALAIRCPRSEAGRWSEHEQTLSGIATIAAAAIETAQEVGRLQTENELLQEQLRTETGIVGNSPIIERLLRMVDRVAAQEATVLILGESGTGKELVARAVHQRSPRSRRPFVAINCAALTEPLLESELFGHEKGAFTGAVAQKRGKLELAEGGTVFLDEIGELAPSLQAKMLRVLQQREFERVGGTVTLHLDVRLVAATNRDLVAEVKQGRFREDLYHRLNVVELRTPPLRERPEDIMPLAEYFLIKASARCRRRVMGFTPETIRALTGYSWPGNVRELENAIERAVVLGSAENIELEDLPETVEQEPHSKFQETLGSAKREAILRAWEQAGGDYKEAASVLGIHPNSLLRLVRKMGLRRDLTV